VVHGAAGLRPLGVLDDGREADRPGAARLVQPERPFRRQHRPAVARQGALALAEDGVEGVGDGFATGEQAAGGARQGGAS
jgi:hypothetical protein